MKILKVGFEELHNSFLIKEADDINSKEIKLYRHANQLKNELQVAIALCNYWLLNAAEKLGKYGEAIKAAEDLISHTQVSHNNNFTIVKKGSGYKALIPKSIKDKYEKNRISEDTPETINHLPEKIAIVSMNESDLVKFESSELPKELESSATFWPRQFHFSFNAHSNEDLLDRLFSRITTKTNLVSLCKDVDIDKIVTVGSCFASHLSDFLAKHGHSNSSLILTEVVNTPTALKRFFNIICENEQETLGNLTIDRKMSHQIRKKLETSDLIVITCGVAVVSEYKIDKKLCLEQKILKKIEEGVVEQRLLSVDEVAEDYEKVTSYIRKINPKIKIIYTVSPVPLTGVHSSLGDVLTADVLSKSIIIAGLNLFLKTQKLNDVGYFPSFEFVKWLSPHILPEKKYASFGADDKNSRHVSKWLVERIMNNFLKLMT